MCWKHHSNLRFRRRSSKETRRDLWNQAIQLKHEQHKRPSYPAKSQLSVLPSCKAFMAMMYVRVYNSFLQPPVCCCSSGSGRWQPEQWWYHYSKHYTNSRSRGMPRIVRQQGKGGGKEKIVCKTAMFGAILSPGPDVVLALLFFPLQRKHTLIQTIWAAMSKCQNIALACFRDSMSCVRVSELGQFTIENPLKDFSRKCAWNVKQEDVELTWHCKQIKPNLQQSRRN